MIFRRSSFTAVTTRTITGVAAAVADGTCRKTFLRGATVIHYSSLVSSVSTSSSTATLLSRQSLSVLGFPESHMLNSTGGGGRSQRHYFSSVTNTSTTNDDGNCDDTSTSTSNNSTKIDSNIYTIGVTGYSGLVGTALQNELLKSTTKITGKPVRVILFRRTTNSSNAIVQPVPQEVFTNEHDQSIPSSSLSSLSLFSNKSSSSTATHFGDEKLSFPKSTTRVLPWNQVPLSTRRNTHTTEEDVIDDTVLRNLDALVHLSGENIATGPSGSLVSFLGLRPWTPFKKKAILESRIQTTSNLAQAIVDSGNTDCDFLVASGVGIYGHDYFHTNKNKKNKTDTDTDKEKLAAAAEESADDSTNNNKTGLLAKVFRYLATKKGDEKDKPAADEATDTSNTTGFLADVSREWEASADAARNAGNRVVHLRNAVVLSTKGGALQKLYPIFFLGGGGIVGPGNQYFPFISARDVARAMVHILDNKNQATTHSNSNSNILEGPINLVAPDGATNDTFTKALGKVVRRPTLFPFPAFLVKVLFGEMGEETLLGGTHAVPTKLLESGFHFQHSSVEEALHSAIYEEQDI